MENEPSPYLAPKSALEDVPESQGVVPASKKLRFFNLIIDYIGFTVLGVVVGVAVAVFFGDQGVEYIGSIPDFILGVTQVLFYYIVFEGLTGRTLGKLVTGTKVVNNLGEKASFSQVIGRSFSRFIPFEAFSFFEKGGRGWHDSLPKTYVIKCR